MRVAIIFPSYTHKKFSENLEVVDNEFCHAPPLILAYVASILRNAGHKVILIDAQILGLSKKKTLAMLRDFDPQILAFRMETYHFHDTLDWIRFLKPKLKIPVVVGGINLDLYPYETLSYPDIDYGIVGDAVESFPQLLEALGNTTDFRTIKGVAYREGGKVIINPPSERIIVFDAYPFPARDLLPNKKYYSFISKKKNFTIMVTTRGCPYKCIFCAIPKVTYHERSPKNVVDEVEECYCRYNIREIDFFDANLFFNKKRFLGISDEILKRKIKIEWSCRSRVDMIDEEIVKAAASSGCRRMLFGIESSNTDILKGICKEINTDQVKEAISLCNKYKILTLGFFMFGNPGETEETIEQTIRYSKELKLDSAQFMMTIAKPNSELNQQLKDKFHIDFWKEHILGRANGKRIPTPWMHLSYKQIEKYTKKAYFGFYFRPSYILKALSKASSLEELIKYIRVGTKMLCFNKSNIRQ